MNTTTRTDFTDADIALAIEHMKTRCPDILNMMERRERAETVASRDAWVEKVFQLTAILNEIGLTTNLSEIRELRFQIQKEVRRRLGLSV